MRRALPLLLLVALALPAFAAEGAESHADPVAPVVLAVALLLAAAKLGGDVAMRLGQPAVLGELVVGVLLGNLHHVGVHLAEPAKASPAVDMLARLGVLVLLFEVGLESTVAQMLQVGWSSLIVAVIGVVGPMALGAGAARFLLPEASGYVHAFVGATLAATSVGITARVLKDIGRSQSKEARIILGAAVIDDVLGLVVLAVVAGAIEAADRGGVLSVGDVGWTLAKAALFLIGSLTLGVLLAPRVFRTAALLRSPDVLLALGLSFCFILAWTADRVGLASIVGAFAAGLILEDLHYKEFTERGEHQLEELIHPFSSVLGTVFFVLMGMRTDLAPFAQPQVLLLAGVLTVAAIVGKLASGFGLPGRGVDRRSIGIGMIPRGEVGLIFANIGRGLEVGGFPIVSPDTFSALVVVVIVTTMITPPALKWSLARGDGRSGKAEEQR